MARREGDDDFEALGWEELGRELRQMRETRQGREGRPGMSQKALANRFKVNTAVVNFAESGKQISARTADFYDAFYDTGGAISAKRDALAERRARRMGRRKGWLTASTPVALREGDDGFREFAWWLRKLRGKMLQGVLAKNLGVSQSVVSMAEKGVHLTERTAGLYDDYFSARGTAKGEISDRWRAVAEAREWAQEEPAPHGQALTLSGHSARLGELLTVMSDERTLALPDGPYQVIAHVGEVLLVAIDRRLFVAAGGLLVPAGALEQTRHDLLGSLVEDRAAADADEWREIVWEYGLRFRSTPPAELLRGLQIDLAALGDALRRQRTDPVKRELQRVAALLMAIAAHTVANLGDPRSARRWWRTAKQAADESGDVETRLWVRGREIVGALSDRLPTSVILDLVAQAEAISAGAETPPTALPQMLGGKTQALALAGQATAAEATLGEFRDNFDRLPAHLTRDTDSLFGFAEHDVRFTESYVYSQVGDFARAEQAQTAALAISPATGQRRPAMIKLQRALCLVRAGDVASGVEHAHSVMTSLPRQHHARPVLSHGHRVLDAVPAGERERDDVRAFRAYLDGHEAA